MESSRETELCDEGKASWWRVGGRKFGDTGVGFEISKGGEDRRVYRHEGRNVWEAARKIGGGGVKVEILKGEERNGNENRRLERWVREEYVAGYVDGLAGAET